MDRHFRRGFLKTGSPGSGLHFVQIGAVVAKKYVGKFAVQSLQDRADTGLWYTTIEGNPHVCTGEGDTPLAAMRDAASRTKAKIQNEQSAIAELEKSAEILISQGEPPEDPAGNA